MKLAIVAAIADNGVIGRNNALLWRLPDDLKYFKALTMGKPIIMGRKTFDSIGKPLPGRRNIVVSRQAGLSLAGCRMVASLNEALHAALTETQAPIAEAMVIGGAEIYSQVLPQIDVLYLTRVHTAPEGDVHFPPLNATQWREIWREEHVVDARHAHAFTFVTLERTAESSESAANSIR